MPQTREQEDAWEPRVEMHSRKHLIALPMPKVSSRAWAGSVPPSGSGWVRSLLAPAVKTKLIVLLFAATLLLSGSPVYSVTGISAAQKERSAHPSKPLKFHYVCPMHEDITSQKRGTCPKCKMKLVKKPVPQEPAQ